MPGKKFESRVQQFTIVVLLSCALIGATVKTSVAQVKLPSKGAFNTVIEGKSVSVYYLKNSRGIQAAITNYGARLVMLLVKDRKGESINVVAGFDSISGYLKSTAPYYGATIGRFANRIAKGKFTLDGKSYQLTINNGENTLHGGKNGFNNHVWDAKQISSSTVKLTYLSNDGEEGFPGDMKVSVTYTLTDENALKINYEASANKPTIVNLTNHSFFNLNGRPTGTILSHTLFINADKFTPLDSTGIPTGQLTSVKGTPYDFTVRSTIGAHIYDDYEQLRIGKGYDINYVLNSNKQALTEAARVNGDLSGIVMKVYTTQPGMQFFSGNFMAGKNTLSGGFKDDYRTAFCLETQHFPDAPNQPGLASTTLRPGQKFKSTTVYQFSTN